LERIGVEAKARIESQPRAGAERPHHTTRCDPFQGRHAAAWIPGVIVASLLDPALQAGNPPGSGCIGWMEKESSA